MLTKVTSPSLFVSILLAVLTVSPNKQYLGMLIPTIPKVIESSLSAYIYTHTTKQ